MRTFSYAALVLSLLLVAGIGSYRGYKIWTQDHSLKLARQFAAKSDLNNALLSLRKALLANPANLEACRLMADLAEGAKSPNAVFWRSRLVELEPDALTNRFALVRAAIGAGDTALAAKTLAEVKPEAKQTAAYHKMAGAVALATGRYPEAEQHFSEAMRAEPDNPIPRLSLAVLRLQRADPQLAAAARAVLEGLRTNALVRPEALRPLAVDALRHQQYARALGLTAELLREPHASFNDRLLELEILHAADQPRFATALAALQHQAATNLMSVFELGRWMLSTTTPAAAWAWLQTVPPHVRTNLPVTMVAADCQLAAKNWAALQASLDQQAWGDLEYLRLTYRTRALREQSFTSAAKTEWTKVMKAADGRLDRLIALQRVAATWDWPGEQEDLLWAIVNNYPGEKGAVRALAELLYAGGKTRSLLTLYALLVQNDPTDLTARNNVAAIAMLLNASEHRPFELARQVFDQQRDNPFYVSTYAYSLYLQQRVGEAVRLMRQLKPDQLENPSISGYYGLLLVASGEKAAAKRYFDLATRIRQLPEERELFRRAAASL